MMMMGGAQTVLPVTVVSLRRQKDDGSLLGRCWVATSLLIIASIMYHFQHASDGYYILGVANPVSSSVPQTRDK